MKALRFENTGSLDGLAFQEIPQPIAKPGEVLVRVKAAAVNPSDIKNVLGGMHETTVPRTPGRDFAGIVEHGPTALSGQSVFGSGGNLGFGRNGSHAEFVVVPENAVLPMPKRFTFEQSTAIGVAYRRAGLSNISHHFYTGGRHEMLGEINAVEVRTNLLLWISSVLGW
jgi:NADPH2:quinone reductase